MKDDALTRLLFDYQSQYQHTPRKPASRETLRQVAIENLFTAQRLLSDNVFATLCRYEVTFGRVALPQINGRDYSAEAVSNRAVWFVETLLSRAYEKGGNKLALELCVALQQELDSAIDAIEKDLMGLSMYSGKIATHCQRTRELILLGVQRQAKRF